MFDEMIVELKAAGATLSEMSKIARLLLTLPSSYDTLVTAIQTQEDDKLNYAFVKIKLLDYEVKLKNEKSDTSVKVLKTEKKSEHEKIKKNKVFKGNFNKKQFKTKQNFKDRFHKFNKKCEHCGRKNHEKKDCFFYTENYGNGDRQRTIQTVQMQGDQQSFAFMSGVQVLRDIKRNQLNETITFMCLSRGNSFFRYS